MITSYLNEKPTFSSIHTPEATLVSCVQGLWYPTVSKHVPVPVVAVVLEQTSSPVCAATLSDVFLVRKLLKNRCFRCFVMNFTKNIEFPVFFSKSQPVILKIEDYLGQELPSELAQSSWDRGVSLLPTRFLEHFPALSIRFIFRISPLFRIPLVSQHSEPNPLELFRISPCFATFQNKREFWI